LQLEDEPAITQAWLNGTGTVLAVVWAENHGQETRTKAVQAVFEKNGLTATELDGEARDTELKSFVSGDAWYHGTDVDNLSKQEARTIAARLVRRVHAKVALSQEQAKTLETGLAQAFMKAYNDGFVGQADKLPALAQELRRPTCVAGAWRQRCLDRLADRARALPTNFYRVDASVPWVRLLSSLFGTSGLFT